jgi:hypothetical protein
MTRTDRPGVVTARLALALLAVAACRREELPPPRPTGVEPAAVIAASGAPVTVRGDRFYVEGEQSLGSGGSRVSTVFRAWVGDAELADVEWVDEGTLRARVPAGLAPGQYDVTVENAFGRGVATQALALLDGAPPTVELAATLPGAVAVGQEVTLVVDVVNAGGGAVLGATPVLWGADPARLATVSSTAEPRDLAVGAGATFRWTFRGVAPGEVELSVVVTGTDERTGGAFASEPLTAAVTVVRPAALVAAASVDRADVTVGGKVTARVEVTNAGPGAVRQLAIAAVAPAFLAAGPVPPTSGLAPGATATFDVPFTAVQGGSGAIAFDVTAVDAALDLPVSAPRATTATLTAHAPASLVASLAAAPRQVSTGQEVRATLIAENRGGSAADVAPSLAVQGTGALAPLGAAPAPARIASGTSREFAWTLRASSPGDVTLSARADGTDVVSGGAVTAHATAGPVTVQSPAQVVVTATASPEVASVGQEVELRVVITNTGGAAADVTAALQVAGAAALSVVSAPAAAPVRVAGGASATLRWVLSAGAAGAGTMTATVAATDVNTGATGTASGVDTVVVEAPARLEAVLTASPDPINDGQQAMVRMRVRNVGGATALDVAPATLSVSGAGSVRLVSGPVSAAVSGAAPAAAVPAGRETWFEWRYAGVAPGPVAWNGGATGKDGHAGWTVTAPAAIAGVQVQRRATLVADPISAPARVNVGQGFAVRVPITNGGDATATAVSAAIAVSPAATATPGDPPAAVELRGGETTELVRWFTGAARGAATVGAAVTGQDATDGGALAATPLAAAVVVERPAKLTASLALPSAIATGELGVTLTVANTGDAVAAEVRPGALAVLAEGTARVEAVASPSGAATLTGGQAASFAWRLRVLAAGTLKLAVTVTGIDANDGVERTVRAESALVPAARDGVRVVAADPLGDGSPFAFVAAHGGAVWVGPSRDGARLARVPGDGGAPAAVALSFARDAVGNVHANDATPYASIGWTGCTPDSLAGACGPDDEDGRGLLTSATLGGEEWLVVGGARSGGDLDYVYLAGGDLSAPAFRYVDLSALLGGNTRGLTAAHSTGGRLYLGFADNGGSRPYGVALLAPPPAPGLDADPGADAMNLGLHEAFKKALGAYGAIAMVDVFAELDGRMYLLADVGCIVSTVPAPETKDDFAGCSPSRSAAYDQADAVGPRRTSDLEPRDRAWPRAAVWNGRLHAIRNTWSGPQLWACDPAGGVDAAVCEPGDWELVAGDADLRTRLGHPGVAAASLLVATPGHLYLGLDDPGAGVHLYRTAAARPSTAADFTGADGCLAGTAGCEGLGGDGLGDPATLVRIFDAKAIPAADGTTDLYLTAGDGVAPVRVIRVED